MVLNVHDVSPAELDSAARHFDEHGFVRLSGLDQVVTRTFEQCLAEVMEISLDELQPFLDPRSGSTVFPQEMRRRLSRIATPPHLSRSLVATLSPILSRLIGPLVHVSSTYHGQFKGGALSDASRDIATYHNESKSDYMEVHGAYRLHQDFTGASLPTSPSGLTLWVALNDCPEATLQLFPGSHRLGLYCHKMWKMDDPRLPQLGPPIEFEARAGSGLLFNALLFHGTGRLGSMRRVSCDIRFFPLTGFLPSEVHALDAHPIETLRKQRHEPRGETTLAPVLEQLAFLGEHTEVVPAPPLSILNWANYLCALMQGDPESALPHFERFINTDLLEDPPAVFTQKFHNRQIHADRLAELRGRAAVPQPQ